MDPFEYCPLKSPVDALGHKYSYEDNEDPDVIFGACDCETDSCAWYDVESERCVIHKIANALAKIAEAK